MQHWSMHSHGAIFCEVTRQYAVTGENARQPLPRLVRLRAHSERQDGAAASFAVASSWGWDIALMEETLV